MTTDGVTAVASAAAATTTTTATQNTNEAPIIRRRQMPSRRRRDGLIQFAGDNTSQNGEDGIIATIFQVLPKQSQRYCVDVGAWDGKHLSNTYSLLVPEISRPAANTTTTTATATGTTWKGILIEADPNKFAELHALHKLRGVSCIQAEVVTTPGSPNELYAMLKSHAPELPSDFDFLCIDIDGSDYWVLHGMLTHKYRPKLICIEFNPTMPDDLIYIPAKTDNIRHGASLAALVELVEPWNYVLIETTLFNAFFVPRDLYEAYFKELVPDTSIEALHEISMGTSLYQLYDGTLKVWGCKKLLWHRQAIDEKKIQMLPPEKRHFPFAPSSDFDMKSAVDMSAICQSCNSSHDDEASASRRKCADALLDQLQADGFAFVRGTGMSQDLCQEALQHTKAFLSEAEESVRRSCLAKDRARRGYSPMCTENFASLIGEQGPNDLVRKFRMGPTRTPRNTSPSDDSQLSSLLQPNIWPRHEVWEDAASFERTIELYFESSCRTADFIVRAICDAVQRKNPNIKNTLEPLHQDGSTSHTSILTLLSYSVGTRHKGKNKSPLVAAHTDVGVITVLLFDGPGCAQLQRSDRQGGWVDVKLPSLVTDDPIFVVNIGDCMSELTGAMLPSTLHRVVAKTKQKDPRHCLALFVGLDPEASLTIQGETTSYEEWRKRRIATALNVLNSNNK